MSGEGLRALQKKTSSLGNIWNYCMELRQKIHIELQSESINADSFFRQQ